jgi:hypothetical protein
MYSSSDARTWYLGPTAADGPVTCAACGCRLQPVGPSDVAAWFHFGSLGGRDARGCRVDCSDMAHDSSGRPAPASALA